MENNRYKTVLGSEKEAHIHTQLNQIHAIINNNKSRIVFNLRAPEGDNEKCNRVNFKCI